MPGVQLVVKQLVLRFVYQAVTDECRPQSGGGQTVGGDQLGQLQPDPRVEARLPEELHGPVVKVVSGIEQQEIRVLEGGQRYRRMLRQQVAARRHLSGGEAAGNGAVDGKSFRDRQQHIVLKGGIPLKIHHKPGVAVEGQVQLPIRKHPGEDSGTVLHQLHLDIGVFL